MDIPIDSIHFPADKRLRQDYGDLDVLVEEIQSDGQLQDILVRPLNENEYPGIDCQWLLVDGGRRFLAFEITYLQKLTVPGTSEGCIGAKIREDEDPLYALRLEYMANSIRKDFTWREKAVFIQRIHEGHKQKYPDTWNVLATSELIRITEQTVYKYLQLVSDPEVFNHPVIVASDSFRTAHKKYLIMKDKKRRADAVHIPIESSRDPDAPLAGIPKVLIGNDIISEIRKEIVHGDARDWIKTKPDDYFAWFHWDPPYGGEQAGGVVPLHGTIEDTEEYAWSLIRDVIPEIWRTLKDGAWLAIWYNPRFYLRLVALLQGHSFVDGKCEICSRSWDDLHDIRYCHKRAPHRFWVNPYPYVWYKENRMSDAHEITRYSVNAYETLLLACKTVEVEPFLVESGWQNVMATSVVPHGVRQHPTQKPAELLARIIETISVPKSRGGDASVGSGTIAEAAFLTWRQLEGCDIDPDYVNIAVENALRGIMLRRDLAQYEKDKSDNGKTSNGSEEATTSGSEPDSSAGQYAGSDAD